MRPLELNLASHPFRNNTPIWVGHALLLAAVVAFSAWNVLAWRDANRSLAAVRSEIGSSDKQRADLDVRESKAERAIDGFNLKLLRVQANKVNDIILRRGLSWTRLFNTLERVVPYEVKMTAVRPSYGTREAEAAVRRGDAQEGVVPIDVNGVAQSLEAFLEFERSLIVDPHFTGVEPVRSETTPGNAEVRFQLHFLYDPEGRLSEDHPNLPHVLEAARKAEEEGGEAPPSALKGLP
jgi:Tfp pilus assembly protein PilN